MKQGSGIGIDEVGRGALAGPVVVVAAMITGNRKIKQKSLGTLKDSKKLNAKQRESWYAYFLTHPDITFAIARVYPREIEKRNISQAANLAAMRALERLTKNRMAKKSPTEPKIFLDGGLYIKNKKWQAANIKNAKTFPKADETVAAVAVASIIAKVHRDRFMGKLAKEYSGYGFEIHKGYGTKSHLAAIRRHGPCRIHRLTFLKLAPSM